MKCKLRMDSGMEKYTDVYFGAKYALTLINSRSDFGTQHDSLFWNSKQKDIFKFFKAFFFQITVHSFTHTINKYKILVKLLTQYDPSQGTLLRRPENAIFDIAIFNGKICVCVVSINPSLVVAIACHHALIITKASKYNFRSKFTCRFTGKFTTKSVLLVNLLRALCIRANSPDWYYSGTWFPSPELAITIYM